MLRKIQRVGFAVLSLCSLTSATLAADPKIARLSIMPLGMGMNTIHNFTPDGRDGAILKTWRDNGNAHGYMIYIVMIPKAAPDDSSWSVVGIERTRNGLLETETNDVPHTGEDNIQSVAFARGKVDGTNANLLIIAQREMGARPMPDPAPTTISIYQLVKVSDDDRVGSTPWIFKLIKEMKPKTRYCNSELALSKEMALPLSRSYAGSNKVDGC